MAVAWGDFESMALHYIKLLASPIHKDSIWIQDGDSGPYGVCSYQEYAQLTAEHGEGRYRPVSTMTRLEFMGLLLVRYSDFFPEVEDATKKKDIQAGEQPGAEHTVLDARGDRTEKGGHGAVDGDEQEEDSNRTVH